MTSVAPLYLLFSDDSGTVKGSSNRDLLPWHGRAERKQPNKEKSTPRSPYVAMKRRVAPDWERARRRCASENDG